VGAVAIVRAPAVVRKGHGKSPALTDNGFFPLPAPSDFFPSLILSVMLLAPFLSSVA
jgi:hypothetical protein